MSGVNTISKEQQTKNKEMRCAAIRLSVLCLLFIVD
jgi:vesicle coat complex subunit